MGKDSGGISKDLTDPDSTIMLIIEARHITIRQKKPDGLSSCRISPFFNYKGGGRKVPTLFP